MTQKTQPSAAAAVEEPLLRGQVDAELLGIPADRLLQDWKQAYERALAYLEALGLPASEGAALATEAVDRALREAFDPGCNGTARTLSVLRRLLTERYPAARRWWDKSLDPFTAWRLDAALSQRFTGGGASAPQIPARDGRFCSMPKIKRAPMVPENVERRFLRRLFTSRPWQRSKSPPAGEPLFGMTLRRQRRHLAWTRVASRRRLLLAILVLIPTTIASGFMVNVLPDQGRTWIEFAIVVFFGALFGWISIGFWTALFGCWTLLRRRDRLAITNLQDGEPGEVDPNVRAAIVMPICEEPVERVFAGLKAIHRSLERCGGLHHFHFFILSDTGDPGTAVREEEAWLDWCREIGGFAHIFYRRRKVRLKRKSGNVADFCRRWGSQYRYMLMLDADSVMAGETVVRLLQLMERHPKVGMIQTAPVAVNRRSLFARVEQFASRVYGPMFAAGLHYWQLGDGQYWGHNTIIRLAPFMQHCSLPRLPGKPPLGGEIMSHDFVEAALMGRAGWTLWLAYDLSGSYEEVPSTLLEEMKRDRRWCQGNLQHLRLLFTEGLFGAHRALFLNGVLSYVSALLWFTFLTLSTVEVIQKVWWPHDYFPKTHSLFPDWPVWRPDWALSLMGVIAVILFLPKLLSVLFILLKRRNSRAYGGLFRLLLSTLVEIVLSSLLAPIRMVFHSRFVLQNLLGRTVSWRSQGREDTATGWREAIWHHGLDTLFASAWGTTLYWLSPEYFWWVTPIISALILSVPLSVYTSRAGLGDLMNRLGLFVIPEESAPPAELRDLGEFLNQAHKQTARLQREETDGFVRAAVDPYANALHRALLGGQRSLRPDIRTARRALLERALADGPRSLSAQERKALLSDPEMVDELHERLWQLGDRARAVAWGRPGTAGRS